MRLQLFALLLILPGFVYSQTAPQFDLYTDVPVNNGIELLDAPWEGGLNSVQLNTLDFTMDGTEDLVIWERFSNSLRLFEKISTGWKERPDLISLFPKISGWMLLRDMNGDNKKDLITYHPLGMTLFINTTVSNVSWRAFNDGKEIRTLGTIGPVNIAMNEDDIPGIGDVDGDGKLDIITFGYLSNSLEYNRNVSVGDSVVFERENTEWGDFSVCSCGIYSFGIPCSPQVGGRTEHSGAKGIFLQDLDGDNDIDLAISEDECENFFTFENIGDNSNAIFRNPSSAFPSQQNPAQSRLYPSAYLEDIDMDGQQDLILGVHLKTNVNRVYDFSRSISYYRNTSTSNIPNYQLQQNNFLQDQMIDLGENASPTFYDIDSDGDYDLFVGRKGEFTPEGLRGSICFYRNIGDVLQPEFIKEDDDWLNLSQLNLNNIKPQFIDVDGDKNIDLALTASSGFEFRALVLDLPNNAFWGLNFSNTITVSNEVVMSLNENAYFYDVDKDFDADLLITRQTGAVEWFENRGGNFELQGDFYGLTTDVSRSNSSITIGDISGNGIDDLLLVYRDSRIEYYADFIEDLTTPVVPEILQFYFEDQLLAPDFKLGSNLRIALSNLFFEDLSSLVIGTGEGGLRILRNRNAIQGEPDDLYVVTPNYFSASTDPFIELNKDRNIAFDIISMTGQQITPVIKVPSGDLLRHSLEGLADGMYLVRIYFGPGQFKISKIVIAR